jgi:hypothetical protein
MGWTQPDPLYALSPELAGAAPRRALALLFSLNNPVRYFDPSGLDLVGYVTRRYAPVDSSAPEEESYYLGPVGWFLETSLDTWNKSVDGLAELPGSYVLSVYNRIRDPNEWLRATNPGRVAVETSFDTVKALGTQTALIVDAAYQKDWKPAHQ